MTSFLVTSVLILLCFWYVTAIPAKSGNWTDVLPEPRSNSSGHHWPDPRWIITPRDLSSLVDKLEVNREDDLRSCGNHNLSPGQTVAIQSENYPGKHPKKINCKWKFKGTSRDSTISIACDDFRLQGNNYGCLQMRGTDLDKKVCTKTPSLEEKSNGKSMVVIFKTKNKAGNGFHCTVRASDKTTTTTTTTTTTPPTTTTTTTTTPPTTTTTTTTTPPTTTTTTTTTPPTTTTTTTTTPPPIANDCKKCGTVNRVTRIVGGTETEVNEYPWIAAIVTRGTRIFVCGGSLLNNRVVVTNAICAGRMDGISVDVLLGAHDLSSESSFEQRIPVERVLAHYDFDSTTNENDIAILILASSANLNQNVKPICFPDVSKDYDGYEGKTLGWGILNEGGPSTSVLNEVDVPIISYSECRTYYGSEVKEMMVCAGYEEGGKDACSGDGGGPLVVYDSGNWVLVGIVSWGYGCARPNFPGVYTRVTTYVDILRISLNSNGENNLCTDIITTTAAPPDETTTTTASPPPSSGDCRCGRTNPVTRIVGGQETTVHEYPWQVGLKSRTATTSYCGGSIIGDRWILTAAHCVDSTRPSAVYVVVGEHNYFASSETTLTQQIQASSIIVHRDYNDNTLDNDIALIRLSTEISFPPNNKIAPVCLPTSDIPYANIDATVTGWGTTSSGGFPSPALLEVTIPTMTNTRCKQLYSPNSITENMICAGLDEGGKDSCQGDSGGPMVTDNNGAHSFLVQIGVVSWGSGCARPNYPGVYTRVTKYISWINTQASDLTTCPRP